MNFNNMAEKITIVVESENAAQFLRQLLTKHKYLDYRYKYETEDEVPSEPNEDHTIY